MKKNIMWGWELIVHMGTRSLKGVCPGVALNLFREDD